MARIQFYQNNYLGKYEDGTEIKICPICKKVFSPKDDDCPNCNLYLPSFPTSWARSATNIFLLRKVLEFIHLEFSDSCNVFDLTKILTDNYIISVDLTRREDKEYWKSGPMRRTAEYLSNLQYLGFILKKEKEFSLTDNGKKLALAQKYSDYIAILSDAFMSLKIGNEFDVRGFYSAYNNHILFQCLRIISDLEKSNIRATIEHLALAIMSKNENEEYSKVLNICLNHDYKEIQNIWFGRGKEFNRVIRGVFVRWLNQVKLIDLEKKNGTIFTKLTKFGEDVYKNYEQKYVIGFEDVRAIEDIKKILERTVDSQYLRLSISSESNNRTGAKWEITVKENLNKLNLNVDWYKKHLDFIKIKLPSEVIMSLTGGTRYNPDLILHDPLWLIDPKKDVNVEMHKIVAYDKYAFIVDGLAIIVTQKIMKDKKIMIMKDQKLKNVLVLDGYALQVLADNNNYFSKEKVISMVKKINQEKYYYINEELIFDEFVK